MKARAIRGQTGATRTRGSPLATHVWNLGHTVRSLGLSPATVHALEPHLAQYRQGTPRAAAIIAFRSVPTGRERVENIRTWNQARTFFAAFNRAQKRLGKAGLRVAHLTRNEAKLTPGQVHLNVTLNGSTRRLVVADPNYVRIMTYLGAEIKSNRENYRGDKVKWLLSQPDAAELLAKAENEAALQGFLRSTSPPKSFRAQLDEATGKTRRLRRIRRGEPAKRYLPGVYGEAQELLEHVRQSLGPAFRRRLTRPLPRFRGRRLYEGELRTLPNKRKLVKLVGAADELHKLVDKLDRKLAEGSQTGLTKLASRWKQDAVNLWIWVEREIADVAGTEEYKRVLASEEQLGPRWQEALGLRGREAKP